MREADLMFNRKLIGFSTVSLVLIIFLVSSRYNYAGEKMSDSTTIPFYDLFYHMDQHFLGSFTRADGLYAIVTIPITYALIKTGADWNWMWICKMIMVFRKISLRRKREQFSRF